MSTGLEHGPLSSAAESHGFAQLCGVTFATFAQSTPKGYLLAVCAGGLVTQLFILARTIIEGVVADKRHRQQFSDDLKAYKDSGLSPPVPTLDGHPSHQGDTDEFKP